ncbi:MFS transporter [Sediminibacterium ginsengisoli]|uniref:Predicted arabinose efflux permease, MFS family n=1 Tax=Sediminibacterium ginsengisoli TaxID=413434 RepID=A0A1T4QEX9_9BACT|nr:MFS transporter [Sediminibacterium ginsengisoli]SKA02061.1 Predicted arabinose efflux permease, MFS family [Sediminibacterium ginsengisoli]
MAKAARTDPFDAVRIPEFRNLVIGRFFFIMGLRMMSTVVGWWIYQLTNAPFAIGLIGLSEVIPALSMALYAGHVIDLSEKRRLLLRGVSLYLLAALTLVALSSSFTAHHLTNHWIAICIYVVIFCTGIIRSFAGPVFNVILAQVVPKDKLQNATTWNQGAWLSASVTGHAAGGFMIAGLGNTNTLISIAMLMTLSLVLLFQLGPKPALNERGEKKTWESVKEGIHFVFRTKEILGALSLDLFAVLFGGAVAMVPVYARDILKVGPQGFGFLNGASDMGSICIVILLTLFPLRKQQGRKLLFAVAGFGICIITFAISKTFWLSFFALMIAGMLDGISVVVRGTIMQLKTPDNMRGRVMSVNSMFINSSNELGQFESGLSAKLMGVVPSVIFGGCMTIGVVIATWFKAPALRKMEY